MQLKSALKVFNQSEVPQSRGVVEGLAIKKLAGSSLHPSERINVGLATFAAGTHEHLHWHMIETFHNVLSGRAIVRDIEGRSYEVSAGDVVYGPPGLRGAHEWDVKEALQILTIKATNAPERAIQFNLEGGAMESRADLQYLIERGVADMKDSIY